MLYCHCIVVCSNPSGGIKQLSNKGDRSAHWRGELPDSSWLHNPAVEPQGENDAAAAAVGNLWLDFETSSF